MAFALLKLQVMEAGWADYAGKLGAEAMPFSHRVAMCELAVKDSDWLAVFSCGLASATRICNLLQQHHLNQRYPPSLSALGCPWRGSPIYAHGILCSPSL